MTNKRLYVFVILLFLVIALTLSARASAENRDSYFEIGIGMGTNLFQSLGTQQALLISAINWRIAEKEKIWFRLEGDAEIINADNKIILVAGVAPMVRKLLPEVKNDLITFFEAGAGLNFISRNGIKDRKFGGCFIFSIMASAGIEFKIENHSMNLSYRYRHLSNGGLYPPNEGIDSHYFIVSARF